MSEMTIENQFLILLARKQIAEKRKITLQEVAEKTGVSRPTLAKWSKNRVTRIDTATIDAFCKYFDCKPGDLIEFIPDPVESV